MNQTVEHWIAVADTLKQQRDQAERERDETVAGAEYRRKLLAALETRCAAAEAERDALRQDAARLDWLADELLLDHILFERIDQKSLNIYELEGIVAEQHGRINPNENDRREAFRRMIDAAMEATP
jgi:hypothetical protein